ncbi:MAG: hypothetical protein HRU26_16865 [Psychroserpens sp.]|nr:hypothetical protein [Psychroserpens sp.]
MNKKKQTTLYKTLSNDIYKYNETNPLKKNGVRYDKLFGVCCEEDSNYPVLLTAKNYDLLLDITKGKYFSNPTLGNAPSAWEMWSGNTYVMDYSNNDILPVHGFTSDGVPIQYSDNSHIPSIGDIPGPFFEGMDNSMNGYGYTVDSSNILFYSKCADANNKLAWMNYIDISFQDTQYYWKAINAQPLAGMSYPSKITIKQQEPKETPFSPVVNDISINDAWCAGLNKIN